MRKFSDLNSGNKIEKIKTKRDLLESIVDETLSSTSDIQGKQALVDTIYKMMEISDHKTRIGVLESIKNVAYKGRLDFNWINESIDNETIKMNSIKEDVIVEAVIEQTIVEEIVTENVAWWLPEVISGIGGILAIGGLGQLLIALQDGKLGEAGKKFANGLSDIKDIANSVKSGKLDSDIHDEVYKEQEQDKDEIQKESVQTEEQKEELLKPALEEIVELNSAENTEVLNALKNGDLGESGVELVKLLSQINATSRKALAV